jgi:hypothetical protein
MTRIAPCCDPQKQPSSTWHACVIPFAGLRGSRTQSTSGCRAVAARVDEFVLTAWFSPTSSPQRLGICNPYHGAGNVWVSGFTDS